FPEFVDLRPLLSMEQRGGSVAGPADDDRRPGRGSPDHADHHRDDVPHGPHPPGLSVRENVEHLQVGDRVLIPSTRYAWQERLVVPAKGPLPTAIRRRSSTAALLLSDCIELSAGDWVIQNAGNSGVARGVDRLCQGSRLTHRELDTPRGAPRRGMRCRSDEWRGNSRSGRRGNRQCQDPLALDGGAGAAMLSLSGCLSPPGTLVLYAFRSEQPGLANPSDIIFRGVTIRSFWLGAPALRGSARVIDATKTGARLIAERKLHIPIARSLSTRCANGSDRTCAGGGEGAV